MTFEWDHDKDQKNIKKHQISFSEIISIFDDPYSLSLYDKKHSTLDEDRWITLGMNKSGLLYLGDEEVIRIISARKPLKKEEEIYYIRYKE
jgi:uncharacterized protein